MNGLYLQYEKLRKVPTKDEEKKNVLCTVDRNRVVALDHIRNLKGIQLIVEYNIENEEEILIQRKGNYCSKLKKGKLKFRKLFKILILDEREPSVQCYDDSRQNQSKTDQNYYLQLKSTVVNTGNTVSTQISAIYKFGSNLIAVEEA